MSLKLRLGEVIRNYECETTDGKLKLYDYWGERWGMLFAYPADFDPVSTTELGYLVSKKEKFKDRNVKCIALSCYPVRSHHIWIEDIRAYSHMSRSDCFPYPIISDPDRDICGNLGILNLMDSEDGRQLADRAVLIVGPDRQLKWYMLYHSATGRSFEEILRVIDSLQLTAHMKVATPAEWKIPGRSECMVLPSLTKDEATELFPDHKVTAVPSGKEYIRTIPLRVDALESIRSHGNK